MHIPRGTISGWRLLAACATASLSLSACTILPSALLNDAVCSAPCWAGITPGTTTRSQAISLLESSDAVAASSIIETQIDEHTGYVSWLFRPGSKEVGGRLFYDGEGVTVLRFLVEDHLSFGELSDHFGPPDQVSAIVGMADSRWLSVTLVYSDRGIAARHFDSDPRILAGSVVVNRDMGVVEMSYFDPNMLDSLLAAGMLIRERYDLIQQSLSEWSGFSEVPYVDETPE